MNTNKIINIKSSNERLLALILRRNYFPNDINFISQPDNNLQIATMSRGKSKESKPHRHVDNVRTIVGTSEVIIVTRGKIQISIYDFDDKPLATYKLKKLDVVYFLEGGHSIKFGRNSRIYEIKQGPYLFDKDKIFL